MGQQAVGAVRGSMKEKRARLQSRCARKRLALAAGGARDGAGDDGGGGEENGENPQPETA